MPAPAYVHFTTLAAEVLWGGFQLGFSEDGCEGQYDPRYDEVYSDDMGGRGGVPSDSQFLGAVGNINLVFTKYTKSYMDQLASFDLKKLTTPAVGVTPFIGSFVRQDGLGGPMILRAPNETLTFAMAFLRGAYRFNSGTKYRRYLCAFELWINQTDLANLTQAQTRRMFTMS